MGDVDARVHIFGTTVLGRGRETIYTLGNLYHGKDPVLMLEEARHEGMKIISTSFAVRNPKRVVRSVAKRIVALAT